MSNNSTERQDGLENKAQTLPEASSSNETAVQTSNNNIITEEATSNEKMNEQNANVEDKESQNNQNQENRENNGNSNTIKTEDNPQYQEQSDKTSGRNRHFTTDQEKKILQRELLEYIKLPNRTTDRQNKERNVAKELKKLSPECDKYWNYKKVRDWFNNNKPTKKPNESELGHMDQKCRMSSITYQRPTSETLAHRYYYSPYFKQNEKEILINNSMYIPQSQFFAQRMAQEKMGQPNSNYIPSYSNPSSMIPSFSNSLTTIPSFSKPNSTYDPNSDILLRPISSSTTTSTILSSNSSGNDKPKNPTLPKKNYVEHVPYDVQHKIPQGEENTNSNSEKPPPPKEDNRSKEAAKCPPSENSSVQSGVIEGSDSPSSDSRIYPEIPESIHQNASVSNSPLRKSSKFKEFYAQRQQQFDSVQRELDSRVNDSSVQGRTMSQPPHILPITKQIRTPTPDFHLTPLEKYHQRIQQKAQSFSYLEYNSRPSSAIFFKETAPSSTSSAPIHFNQTSQESMTAPGSFIIEPTPIKKKKPPEEDPLPVVPEDELRACLERIKSTTLNRISMLLRTIDQRKVRIYKFGFNNQIKRKIRPGSASNSSDEICQAIEDEKKDEDGLAKEKEAQGGDYFNLTKEGQIDFEVQTEKRMNELLRFFFTKFGENQQINLNLINEISEKSQPPALLTPESLQNSLEFSPTNKHSSDDTIQSIIEERKCIVNFGRNNSFKNKIRVPKEIIDGKNERLIKFYRGEFDKRDITPLTIYDSPAKIEKSMFLENSDGIFFTSFASQEDISLFIINESFIQTPFKRTPKEKALCQYPPSFGKSNLVLATDGDKLVCINIDEMNSEFIYNVPSSSSPFSSNLRRAPITKKSESVKEITGFRNNVNHFNPTFLATSADFNPKVAICATSVGDIIIGKNSFLYFFNPKKDPTGPYDKIKLENMHKISVIYFFELRSKDKDSTIQSVPLIAVGADDYPTIYVYNANDHSLVSRLVGHTSGISCFYGKGSLLFSGSVDGSIRLWEFNLIAIGNEEKSVSDYIVYSGCKFTLFFHDNPIVSMQTGVVGDVQFLISSDKHLIRATDLNRKNPSFSISVPTEFDVNSIRFNGGEYKIDCILASKSLKEYNNRLAVFAVDAIK